MKRDIAAFRRLTPPQQIAEIRGQRAERVFQVERKSIDKDARTVWLSISSERPYDRWWGVEILDHRHESIRAERLESGAPLLVGHDSAEQVGVVERHELSPDKRLRILARFSKSTRAEEIWQDVLDGIRRNSSVGYIIHDLVLEKSVEGVNTYRVTDWEPYEGSLVAVPADPSVGVGRGAQNFLRGKEMDDNEGTAVELERVRVSELLAAGEHFKADCGLDLARELIRDPSANSETFRRRMLERLRGRQKPFATAQPFDMPYGAGAREILRAPKYFTGADAQQRAYAAGMWIKGLFGNEEAARWCVQNGLELRAMSAAVLSQGGALVPDVLASTVIDLADQHGRFRENADSWPMKSDTLQVPRSTSDPAAGFVGESGSIPESEGAWDVVNLSAKKIGTIVRVPTELIEDAVISVADRVAFQLARAFAKKEDECGFIGDGTSTYGGIRGIFNLLVDGNHNAGKIVAAANHDTFAEIDAADLASVVAALPEYAHDGAAWYCSQVGWAQVFFRLLMTAGGNSASDMAGKVPRSYGGYPVVLSSVLPSGAATDYSALTIIGFGNLKQSSKFGAKREIRIEILTERYADVDQIGVKATERFDIVNHDLGNNTTAGPMVGLVGN